MTQPNNAQELLANKIRAIQVYWETLFPEFKTPDSRQCRLFLKDCEFRYVIRGLELMHSFRVRHGYQPE